MTSEMLRLALEDALEKRAGLRFAVLFGSGVTHGLDKARDVDIAVSFGPSPSWMALGALESELAQITVLEPDLADLEDASTLLRREVLNTGRLITAPDHAAWLDFQRRIPLEYEDLRPFLERESAGLRRILAGCSGSPTLRSIPTNSTRPRGRS